MPDSYGQILRSVRPRRFKHKGPHACSQLVVHPFIRCAAGNPLTGHPLSALCYNSL